MNTNLISTTTDSSLWVGVGKAEMTQGKLIEPRFHQQKMADNNRAGTANTDITGKVNSNIFKIRLYYLIYISGKVVALACMLTILSCQLLS